LGKFAIAPVFAVRYRWAASALRASRFLRRKRPERTQVCRVAQPDYFTSTPTTNYQNVVNGSLKITETVSAGYIRGDLHAFD